MKRKGMPVQIVLAELCNNAVQRNGGDFQKTRSDVADQVAGMSAADRAEFEAEISRILRFRAPERGTQGHH